MIATIKLFIDQECTKEVPIGPVADYLLLVGNKLGVNGNSGETVTIPLFSKNVGNRAALNCQVDIIEDPRFYVLVSTDNVEYTNSIDLGDYKELEVKKFYVKVDVPRWTNAVRYYPVINVTYYSLPEIDTVFLNPYTDIREVAE